MPHLLPITVNTDAATYPAAMPMIKGISFIVFVPLTDASTVAKNVMMPIRMHTRL